MLRSGHRIMFDGKGCLPLARSVTLLARNALRVQENLTGVVPCSNLRDLCKTKSSTKGMSVAHYPLDLRRGSTLQLRLVSSAVAADAFAPMISVQWSGLEEQVSKALMPCCLAPLAAVVRQIQAVG